MAYLLHITKLRNTSLRFLSSSVPDEDCPKDGKTEGEIALRTMHGCYGYLNRPEDEAKGLLYREGGSCPVIQPHGIRTDTSPSVVGWMI